jgi:hypothetical protein
MKLAERLTTIATVCYLAVAVATYGHVFSDARTELLKSSKHDASDAAAGAAMFALVGAGAWPLYWSVKAAQR